MTIRPTSTAVAAARRSGPTSAHESLGDAPDALAALVGTLSAAFEAGVEHVHVEPSDPHEPTAPLWRLRLRQGDGLEERRLPANHALPDALARLSALGNAFTVPLGGQRHLVELVTRETTRGPSHLLTLHGNALAPRRLDELGLDPRRLRALRTRLAATGGGWLPVGSCSAVDGAGVVRALAQELASPERALLCLESGPHPPLPRVTQIDIAGGLPEPLAPDTDAVLLAASPPDAVLGTLAARAAEGLLVVQRTIARRASEPLARLLALGLAPAWLALNVPAVLMRYRVRLLCPHCRVRDAEGEPRALSGASREPGIVDVAAWLESSLAPRHRLGKGCERCRGSGCTGVRDLTEIVTPDEGTRVALLSGEVSTALARVDASSDLVTRLPALVASGEIAAGGGDTASDAAPVRFAPGARTLLRGSAQAASASSPVRSSARFAPTPPSITRKRRSPPRSTRPDSQLCSRSSPTGQRMPVPRFVPRSRR